MRRDARVRANRPLKFALFACAVLALLPLPAGAEGQPIVFTTVDHYVSAASCRAIAAEDFDGDGVLDLLVSGSAENRVLIHPGNGDGTFGPPRRYPTGVRPIGLAAGDLNGDDWPDAVVACFSGNRTDILLNDGAGNLVHSTSLATSTYPIYVYAEDLDKDGDRDIVVQQYYPGGAWAFANSGTGTFTALGGRPGGYYTHWSDLADVDADGYPDLVLVNTFGGTVAIHRNLSGAGFTTGAVYTLYASLPLAASVGDVDGDSHSDLAIVGGNSSTGTLRVLRGDGAFGFTSFIDDPTEYGPCVEVSDLNLDGLADVIVAGYSRPYTAPTVVYCYPSLGAAGLGAATITPVGAAPYWLLAKDLDEDGRPDLSVANDFSSSISVLRNGTSPPGTPPVAVAGDDQTVECRGPAGTPVTLSGTQSSDADGDPLTAFWYEDGVLISEGFETEVLLDQGVHEIWLVVSDGQFDSEPDSILIAVADTTPPMITAPVDLTVECVGGGQVVDLGTPEVSDVCDPAPIVTNDAPALFYRGETVVTWTAIDASGNSASATQVVAVADSSAPRIEAPPDLVVECTGSHGQTVDLGEPIVSDGCDPSPTVMNDAPALFFLGRTVVLWTVVDAAGNRATARQTVDVVDTRPPVVVSVAADPAALWPPNHQMVPVTVSVIAVDIGDPSPACRIVAVSSSEAADGRGDGNTAPDFQVTGALTLLLRAERSGNGPGRSYTVLVECRDVSGNFAPAAVVVSVAHDQRPLEAPGAGTPSAQPASGQGSTVAPLPASLDGGVGAAALGAEESGDASPASEGASGGSASDSSGSGAAGQSGATAPKSSGPVDSFGGGSVGGLPGQSAGGTKPAGKDKPKGPEGPVTGNLGEK